MHSTRFMASLAAGALLAFTPAVFAQFSITNLVESVSSLEAPPAPVAALTKEGHPMLGVMLGGDDGAPTIASVISKSPAAKAGLKSGDVITSVGDAKVDSRADLLGMLSGLAIGDEVLIGYERDGSAGRKSLVLADSETLDPGAEEREEEREEELREAPTPQVLRHLKSSKVKRKPAKPAKVKKQSSRTWTVAPQQIDLSKPGQQVKVILTDIKTGDADVDLSEVFSTNGELGELLSEAGLGRAEVEGILSKITEAAAPSPDTLGRLAPRVGKQDGDQTIGFYLGLGDEEVDAGSDCDCCPDCGKGASQSSSQAHKIYFGKGGAVGEFSFNTDDDHAEQGLQLHQIDVDGQTGGTFWSIGTPDDDHEELHERMHARRGHGDDDKHVEVIIERSHGDQGHGRAPHGHSTMNLLLEEMHNQHGGEDHAEGHGDDDHHEGRGDDDDDHYEGHGNDHDDDRYEGRGDDDDDRYEGRGDDDDHDEGHGDRDAHSRTAFRLFAPEQAHGGHGAREGGSQLQSLRRELEGLRAELRDLREELRDLHESLMRRGGRRR